MRLRRDSRNPDVLVVCTANAIRSPFVAHLLEAQLSGTAAADLRIGSAGTAARPAQPAASEVQHLAHARGISLDDHRTRRLTEEMLHDGVTVLCAERAHRRVVLNMRPDLVSSVFTMREFARLVSLARASGEVAGGWAEVVAAAARARFGDRHVAEADDDLIDPVGQSSEVWAVFEHDAVDAVTTIVETVRAAEQALVDGANLVVPTSTRRAYRAALRDLTRP